ncbi:hypothetical protein JHK85_004030 [Glycine max]|nr:hypothetical protein JHK85_004030 [Glycine max]
MDETQDHYYSSSLPESSLSHDGGGRSYFNGQINRGTAISGLKKRGHGSRSWIKIGQDGNFQTVTLDKATIMRYCSLPSRDLRLLDPMFIYPSTILGREKAIVVNLEQIRCIITADEVILMNSLDGSVGQYRLELCNRLQNEKADDLPFEFRALELALELTCTSLDAQAKAEHECREYNKASFRGLELARKHWETLKILENSESSSRDIYKERLGRTKQSKSKVGLKMLESVEDAREEWVFVQRKCLIRCVNELEMEIYPVLDELASSISTLNLERVRRFKGHLLALTQRVQKVRDEIEHLMDDDGDMAEMCLTEKKRRSDTCTFNDCFQTRASGRLISKSAPASPERTISGVQMLQRAFSSIGNSSKHGSSMGSSDNGERIEPLEMLLEAYFIVIDNTLNTILSLKEYIDDTEDFINIKLGNIQNQLIQFELLLTAATLVAAVFAAVAGVFGMNFETTVFDYPSGFHWVLVITGIACIALYFALLFYFRYKKVLAA